jgi:hypothetical protein
VVLPIDVLISVNLDLVLLGFVFGNVDGGDLLLFPRLEFGEERKSPIVPRPILLDLDVIDVAIRIEVDVVDVGGVDHPFEIFPVFRVLHQLAHGLEVQPVRRGIQLSGLDVVHVPLHGPAASRKARHAGPNERQKHGPHANKDQRGDSGLFTPGVHTLILHKSQKRKW